MRGFKHRLLFTWIYLSSRASRPGYAALRVRQHAKLGVACLVLLRLLILALKGLT
jgi:hypothetical protein